MTAQFNMKFVIMIFVLLAALAYGKENCNQRLGELVEEKLRPRIERFNLTGEGLDWIDSFQECKQIENSTYGVILWKTFFVTKTSFGFCVPQECFELETEAFILYYLSKTKLHDKVPSDEISLKFFAMKSDPDTPNTALFFKYSFLVLLILTSLGTLLTPFISSSNPLSSFSLFINIRDLFSLPNNFKNLQFFDGIRAISSISLLAFHVFFLEIYLPIPSRGQFNQIFHSINFTLLTSISLVVDVFFFLGGFLMSFLTIPELQKKREKFSWTSFFLRRLIRYLPVYYFLIGNERMGSGSKPENLQMVIPYATSMDLGKQWWYSLFFAHNLVTVSHVPYLSWTWTCAADFQFYVLSCIVLVGYVRNKTLGYCLAGALVFGSIWYTGIVSFIHGLSPSTIHTIYDFNQMSILYVRPVPRIAVFIIGMGSGMVYLAGLNKVKGVSTAYEVKDSFGERFEKACLNIFNKESKRLLIYFISLSIFAFNVIGPYYLEVFGEESLSQIVKSIWISIHRPLFGIGICCWVFPLLLGHLYWVNYFLQLKVFRFLSKISYSLYMIHPMIFIMSFMSGSEYHEPSLDTFIDYSAILLVRSIIVASILYVLIEKPFLNLEKRYLSR